MTGIALCTLVADRPAHLDRLLTAVEGQTRRPDRVCVAVMGGADPQHLLDGRSLPVLRLDVVDDRTELPLGRARNAARDGAGDAELLIFIDVDIILSPTAVEEYADRVERDASHRRDRIWSGHVRYLHQDHGTAIDPAVLARHSRAHPARPRPPEDQPLPRPELFWSTSFATTSSAFDLLGGFDERFSGYGAEDTDLGLRAADAGVDLWWTPRAEGYHQHHPGGAAPVHHLLDIARNSLIFRSRWGRWPMEGWLSTFESAGLIRWDPHGSTLEVTDLGRRRWAAARRPEGTGRVHRGPDVGGGAR